MIEFCEMVVQLESEELEETRIQKHTLMESKKYVIFKNHVREIKEQPAKTINIENVTENTEKEARTAEKKRFKQGSSSPASSQVISSISNEDLEELKTVYKRCKSVITKIERKYGHLLDLDEQNEFTNCKRRKLNSNESRQECKCVPNKKILFTEDGEKLSQVDTKLENHICSHNNSSKNKYQHSNEHIEIDYETVGPILPETIQELTEILKDPKIGANLRNKVIDKVRYLRYENLNTIRFNKVSLVKQLKSNPEEIIDFKGTNISNLEGYPTKEII